MANPPKLELVFKGDCPDCGRRKASLPDPLPDVGDDFVWTARDFDTIRAAMLEELAGRFPERRRWTPADLEVVLVELLAGVVDQLSDQLDRVAAEGYLESARRPESVRRLLGMIGYDATLYSWQQIGADELDDKKEVLARKLEDYWSKNPYAMEAARRAGPRAIHDQERMVTLSDYGKRLEDHPLVERAHSWSEWTGSWTTVKIAVIACDETLDLDQEFPGRLEEETATALAEQTRDFHRNRDEIPLPPLNKAPTIRSILTPYVERYRMLGSEVMLEDAVPVGISMALSIVVAWNHFQSEVDQAVEHALAADAGGFFAPGRSSFGADLHAGDLFEVVMSVEGVENVCLNRFKRVGSQYPDCTESGVIVLEGIEIAVCDNDPDRPERGYWAATYHGGKRG